MALAMASQHSACKSHAPERAMRVRSPFSCSHSGVVAKLDCRDSRQPHFVKSMQILRLLAHHAAHAPLRQKCGAQCLGDTYCGDFSLKGADLRARGLNRVGNMLVCTLVKPL